MSTDIDGVTQEQAAERARARWPGRAAFAEKRVHDLRAPYRVGYMRNDGKGSRRVVVGRGLTWERAFLSADKRESRPPRVRRSKPKKRKRGTVLEQLTIPFEGAHGRAASEG